MIGTYTYTPSIWPSFFIVVLLIALAVYSGRRRNVPGALPFALGSLFGSLWVSGSIMEASAVDMETKIFWFKVQGVCILPAVTAITYSILDYAWPGRWLSRRNLVLLSIPCLLILGLALTNNPYHLLWRGFEYHGKIFPIRGLANWMALVYGYGLTLVNLIVFVWLFVRSPQHRLPVVIMLAGMVAGRLLLLLETAKILQSEVPPFALEYLMYAIALFGFRIFDPIPLARQTAIEQLHSGMMVLDPQGRIVSLNPAAERVFHLPAKRLIGQSARELLPAYLEGYPDDAEKTAIELSIGDGQAVRQCTVETSALNDWRGLAVGRLVLLHDVTEQRRAQAQVVEQQRALAMLHEREQLARELHDSIGQVLGFASLKMGATRKLIADGRLDKADNQLRHMESVITEAHADVREYILNLRATPTMEKPFFSALRHYLDGFRQNYGIQVEFSIGAGVDDDVFAQEAQMQLFRIIQEAFSNARKHAETNCVRLSFEMEDSLVCIRIQDNGQGFDPQLTVNQGGDHFGLCFMRERAEQLGGALHVESAPGQGTCVEVEVPVNNEQ
jgi:PAS domain S-box-containing protein